VAATEEEMAVAVAVDLAMVVAVAALQAAAAEVEGNLQMVLILPQGALRERLLQEHQVAIQVAVTMTTAMLTSRHRKQQHC
jgi:uncharacterized protein (DUF1800 family)